MELEKDLEAIVSRHEKICSSFLGGFEYKELVKELRELLNKVESERKGE